MGLLFLLYIGYKRDFMICEDQKFNMARDVFYAFESNIDSQYVLDETEIGTLFALTLS